MWFTEVDGNQIGRITPTGGITEFTLSGAHTGLFGITSGPKGDLWFTETDKSRIGEITPAGIVVSFTTVGSRPLGITRGPMGISGSSSKSPTRSDGSRFLSRGRTTGLQCPGRRRVRGRYLLSRHWFDGCTDREQVASPPSAFRNRRTQPGGTPFRLALPGTAGGE